MDLDLQKLRPAALVRLLNSTELGIVIDTKQLYQHRNRAGFRIGDGNNVNVFRYAAWLHEQCQHERLPQSYAEKKERARQREVQLSAQGRDIGALPSVVNPQRKQTAAQCYRTFCETYFPQTFHLGWSRDHLIAIAKIEQAVLNGGLFALAMPRGSGKTSLAECAALWALLYGHRLFVVLIGSDEGAAASMLDSIKTELECNELLLEDFPEVCYPIHKLEGIAHRCKGQLYLGERTNISWTANEIILPTIKGSAASGALIRVAGITGRIRGMKYKHPDGQTLRPSLVIPDDPQTDESAKSLSQCATRERIIAGAVLGLAGPSKKIAGIMPCTVIHPGDLADRILDRDKHPEWNGERTKLVESFPRNETLWDQYAEIRAESLRVHGNINDATAFYKKHQTEMDVGAVVSWADRFNHDEASAIQHAMNLKLTDEEAFWSEYQNEPLPDTLGEERQLDVDHIARQLNGFTHRVAPANTNHVTAFIDVQGSVLFYTVCAWEDNFTGAVIDYGTYPDQRRQYFTLRDIRSTLQRKHRGLDLEGTIYAGLEKLTEQLATTTWQREDGSTLTTERILIDANWGNSTDCVYQLCRASTHSHMLTPSHGRYVGASSKPFNEYLKKRGDRIGHNWRQPARKGKHAMRYVLYDTNYWKSHVAESLWLGLGSKGTLSIYGKDAIRHQLFAEHCSSEYFVKTIGRGRSVNEWKMRPGISDNHWWDCLVGCAVAASMHGVTTATHADNINASPSGKRKLSELQLKKRLH